MKLEQVLARWAKGSSIPGGTQEPAANVSGGALG